MGIATLGLALSANAANVKLGADGGALVFDPATVTIKAGETVTWTNNVGFPHNVVFDEDSIPVRCLPFQNIRTSSVDGDVLVEAVLCSSMYLQ